MQINLPENVQTELHCLGAILNSINAANEAFSTLCVEDFYNIDHQKIFSMLKEIYSAEQGCNLNTAAMKMSDGQGNYNIKYLMQIDAHAWSGMPYEEYFRELRNMSSLRKCCFAAKELIFNCSSSNANYENIIAEHQTKIVQTMGISSKVLTAHEIYEDYRRDMSFPDYSLWKRDRFRKGLPTYEGVESKYERLDATLGSFQNGGLYYVGARTSMGKTTFILNLISKMLTNYRIGVFSLEMDAPMILEKLLCIHTDLKYSKFNSGNFTDEELERVKSIEPFFRNDTLFIEDEQALTIGKLTARAKRMKNNNKIDILFVDYLTLIKADGKHANRHMQVDEVSKGLQSLAKILKIPVVCLAQLNRASLGEKESRPSLAHFRESGSIEEDADACLLLHRPEYYNTNDCPGVVEVIIAKNRIMGTLKTIYFNCNSFVSERYHESDSIQDQVKKAQEKDFYEGAKGIFGDQGNREL